MRNRLINKRISLVKCTRAAFLGELNHFFLLAHNCWCHQTHNAPTQSVTKTIFIEIATKHCSHTQSINAIFRLELNKFHPPPPSTTYRTTEKHNLLSVNPKTKWEENSRFSDVKIFFASFSSFSARANANLENGWEKRQQHRIERNSGGSLSDFLSPARRAGGWRWCAFPRRETKSLRFASALKSWRSRS